MRQNSTGCHDLNAAGLLWAFFAAKEASARPRIQAQPSYAPPLPSQQSIVKTGRLSQPDTASLHLSTDRYIADPFLVGSIGAEIPCKQVRRDQKIVFRVGCRFVFPCRPGPQILPPHAGHHCFAIIPVALIKQIKNQTRRTCPHLPGSKGGSNQFIQNHAFLPPSCWLPSSLTPAVQSAARDAQHPRLMVVILNAFTWLCMKAYFTSGFSRSTLQPFL